MTRAILYIITVVWLGVGFHPVSSCRACTGLTLKGEHGTVVLARTQEWRQYDLQPKLVAFPDKTTFQSNFDDKHTGLQWTSKFSFIGVKLIDKFINCGFNEKGIAGALFYHKHSAEYNEYEKDKGSQSVSPKDVLQYILSMSDSLEDVIFLFYETNPKQLHVVWDDDFDESLFYPMHCILVDADGRSVVIEFIKKSVRITQNKIGVITNDPSFDWHLTNLSNYINLPAPPLTEKRWGDFGIKPLSGGINLIGLPGDFTSPSRFVRAALFRNFARKTTGSWDTAKEAFRILDNFNLPSSEAEGGGAAADNSMPSGTQYTVAMDVKKKIFYYHTMFNRRVRKVEFNKIVFKKGKANSRPLDVNREESIENVLLDN